MGKLGGLTEAGGGDVELILEAAETIVLLCPVLHFQTMP